MVKSEDSVWSFSKPEQKVQWPYNRWFGTHIRKRTRYAFVRTHWDQKIYELMDMEKLEAEKLEPGAVRLSNADRSIFGRISKTDTGSLMALLDVVADQASADAFCGSVSVDPTEFKDLLQKIYKYLPFGAQMRQLVEKEDLVLQNHVDCLVSRKLGFTLAFLDRGLTPDGRDRLAEDTGLQVDVVLDLIRRADLTRLRLMSGGMIRQSWALGYQGLKDLKVATPEEYYDRCATYYAKTTGGLPFDLTPNTVAGHIARMRKARTLLVE